MYQFAPVPPGDVAPWDRESLADRMAMLRRRRGRRVAYVYRVADTSTFRYRCWNMAHTLAACSKEAAAACFFGADAARAGDICEAADVVVICRYPWDDNVAAFVAAARARRRRLLFDVDDMVFDPALIEIVMRSVLTAISEENWQYFFSYAARLNATLRCCDGHITTNAGLSEMLARALPGGTAAVVPNFLNQPQIDISRQALRSKQAAGWARDGALHVGYFSGSLTHAHDLAVAAEAIADLLRTHGHARLRLAGLIDPPNSLSAFADRIDRVPLTDPFTLQTTLAQTEVSIAPLRNTLFTRCKSELKWFEAAIAGCITVATPTPPFQDAIRDGENGFLARAGEWRTGLRRAIETVGDEAFILSAARDAEERYGWHTMAPRIEAAVFG